MIAPKRSAASARGPSPELRARVLDAVRAEPVPSRPTGRRRRAIVLVLGFALVVALAANGGGPQLKDRPLAYVVALTAAWLPLAALATAAALGRGRTMLGRPAAFKLAVALTTPVALMGAWLAVAFAWPETLHDRSGSKAHLFCIFATVLLSVGPLGSFLITRRRSDPVSPRMTGAAIGAAAGAWGAVGLPLSCGFTAPLHIFLGHVLPVGLLAAVGAVLGGRVLAVRARTVSGVRRKVPGLMPPG